MLTDGVVSKLFYKYYFEIMFSLFYLLVKTTKRDFRSIKYAEIKQVLSFKQVSVTLSNFLNRKNKKQEKNRFQNLKKILSKYSQSFGQKLLVKGNCHSIRTLVLLFFD